jgi:uncharacterized membrane protein
MDHDHQLTPRRIEAFSDGVFGLVATLLVLDLKLPDAFSNMTNKLAISILLHLLPQFLSFAQSFFIVCIFWISHHQFFLSLKKADRKLLWLNNILLFWLCFIPFPTAFLGRYPTNQVAVIVYGSALFLATSSLSLMRYYAFFGSDIHDEHISQIERQKALRLGLLGCILFAVSIIAAFISVYISLAIFVIVPWIYVVPRRVTFS